MLNGFYRQPRLDDRHGHAGLRSGGGGVGRHRRGGILQAVGDMPAYVTFYVAVEDLVATLERVQGLGGTTVVPPTPIPGVGAFAMFEDPEGHMLGIIKQQG